LPEPVLGKQDLQLLGKVQEPIAYSAERMKIRRHHGRMPVAILCWQLRHSSSSQPPFDPRSLEATNRNCTASLPTCDMVRRNPGHR
jgi:hypothetical protein